MMLANEQTLQLTAIKAQNAILKQHRTGNRNAAVVCLARG